MTPSLLLLVNTAVRSIPFQPRCPVSSSTTCHSVVAGRRPKSPRYGGCQFGVDLEVDIQQAPSDARFMHDLPAKRGLEVTDEVMDGLRRPDSYCFLPQMELGPNNFPFAFNSIATSIDRYCMNLVLGESQSTPRINSGAGRNHSGLVVTV